MAKLTRRSLNLSEGFSSDHGKKDLVQKLGYLEHRGREVAEEMCDFGCRFPLEADPDALKSICESCPVMRLAEILG